MVPDANICLLRFTVETLCRLSPSAKVPGLRRYSEDLFAARIDCQTRVRANRSVLELMADEASALSLASEDFKVCEAAEEIVRQLAPSVLDLWEVPR